MAERDEATENELPGVGGEAVGHMERLQDAMAVSPGVIVQKVTVEVVRVSRDDGFYFGGALYASGTIPERPRRRLIIEWEESGD